MSATAQRDLPKNLTVDEYLAWAKENPGRYELHDGEIVAMSPQRAEHADVKASVYMELRSAIAAAKAPCKAMPDGMTVRISKNRAFEPDALVYCGKPVPGDAWEIPNPVIVVEVASPSTAQYDATSKLASYFSVPSILHYLLLIPSEPPAILHSRQPDGSILTRILHGGTFKLDPPGLELDVARCLALPD